MATSSVDLNALLSSLGSGATGINVSAAVSSAIYAESAPERQWQAQQTTLQQQQGAINQLNSLASSLSDSLNALSDPVGAMTSLIANSSNSNVVTASATSGTTPGNHVVVVKNLATTAAWYSDSESTSSTQLAVGSFTLQVGGGTTTTIPVGSGVTNTLDQLASYVNSQNLGVTASVISDANGARLAIVSQSSGQANDITITTPPPPSGTTSAALGFTQAVQGENSSITIDGIPVGSATNTVTGAVNGLTLNLQSAAPGTEVNVLIAPDTTSIAQALNNFVSAYNAMVTDVTSQFAYNSTTNTSGPLSADSSVRSLQGVLLGVGGYQTAGNIPTLGAMGISMANDGTLTVDSSALGDALQNNFGAVENFFQGSASNGFASSLNSQLNTYTDPAQGAFTLDLKSIATENSSLQDHITTFGLYIASEQTRLTAEYSQADILLQELPNQMNQIDSMLGYNTKNNG